MSLASSSFDSHRCRAYEQKIMQHLGVRVKVRVRAKVRVRVKVRVRARIRIRIRVRIRIRIRVRVRVRVRIHTSVVWQGWARTCTWAVRRPPRDQW